MYRNCLKRVFDFLISLIALILLSPLMLVLTVVGAIAMKGNPFFTQQRPGKNEKIFRLIKFRSMSNARDKDGNLLPDEKRLGAYGKFLRSSSLDELPELWNILIGEMALIGPRPQLVRDMVFMTDDQRRRHSVRPGLSGLAQVNGRNAIEWEKKLAYDLEYIENITFSGDIKILVKTIGKVLSHDDITREGTVSDLDLGDYLLQGGKISLEEYTNKIKEAGNLL